MKQIFYTMLFCACVFYCGNVFSQVLPAKQWDKTFGGSDNDQLFSLQQTADGGYIAGGFSYSNVSGDKSESSRGVNDYWIIKMNASGQKEWDKTFGGNFSDELKSVQQTSDGGYILGGYSFSNISGDKTESSRGNSDYWVVKMSAAGVKQWDKTFGGSDNDQLFSLQQTSDGGYILGGYSSSNSSGDKTENSRGLSDYWIIKINANGQKEWDKTLGGSNGDQLFSIQQTADGGYILGGTSSSNSSGDKTENSRGVNDYWILKINGSGQKEWDKTFGGIDLDELKFVRQTPDGGYLLGGYSNSGSNGDKTENSRGVYDYWIVKINAGGVKQWDKTFGGSDNDQLFSLQQTADGGYIFGGLSSSNNSGDKSENSRGKDDYWVLKINGSGQKEWDKTFGGNENDRLFSLQQTTDNGYILGGHSISNISGDKTENSKGDFDYWIIKLCSNPATYYRDADGDGFGNSSVSTQACAAPSGYVPDNKDCDDSHATVYPGAPEVCDGLDNNCNGQIDDGVKSTFYHDKDFDGYGDPNDAVLGCSPPLFYVSNNLDCDDANPAVHYGAPEICDGLDNDCNEQIDEGVKTTFYRDADGDGYGNAAISTQDCTAPDGYVANNTDCDDSHATVYPSAPEVCDGLDNNCNGQVDEGVKSTFYRDEDGDGYGNPYVTTQACTAPNGYVTINTDCDDTKATVYPGAVEVCGNSIDDNCNGQVDESCATICVTIVPSFTFEGNSGKRSMLFIVALNKPAAGNCSVKYMTYDGSAKAGSDYQKTDGTVSFSKGQWLKFIKANVYGDKQKESNEQFGVQLQSPVNVKIYGTGKATGTIFNDDDGKSMSREVIAQDKTNGENQSPEMNNRSLRVFPNPVRNILNVNLYGYNGDVIVQLITLNGKVLRQQKLQSASAKFAQQQINVSDLANGIYFLAIIDEKGNRRMVKVVISR